MRLLASALLTLLAFSRAAHAEMNGTSCCAPDVKLHMGRCDDGERPRMSCTGRVLVGPAVTEGETLNINEYGQLRVEPDGSVFQPSEYCVSELRVSGEESSVALVCLPEFHYDSHRVGGVLMLVSVLFVLLTITVYVLLPQLRDLHGKSVMCMCGCMAVSFVNLAVLQLSQIRDGVMCHTHGFMIYFWMIAMFFWMNVICIHMWVTAAGDYFYRRKASDRTDGQQFAYYSIYAWGISFAFLVVTLLTNYTTVGNLSPGIGELTCWFKGALETWIYFYGPIGILLTVNAGLFIATSGFLWQSTASQHISNLTLLKYRFTLYLKLFLLTGLSWICEVASFAHGQNNILWYITDTINCLQGVIIFLVLVVFRKRAICGLANAGYLPCLKDFILRWFHSEDDVEREEIVPEDDLEQPTQNHNLEDLPQQSPRELTD